MTIFFAPCCSSPLQFDLQAQEISAFMMQNEIATTAQSVNHCSKWSILGDFFLTATSLLHYFGPLPKCTMPQATLHSPLIVDCSNSVELTLIFSLLQISSLKLVWAHSLFSQGLNNVRLRHLYYSRKLSGCKVVCCVHLL